MTSGIPLAIIPLGPCKPLARLLAPLTRFLGRFAPEMNRDLKCADLAITADDVMLMAVVNTGLLYFLFAGLFFSLLVRVQKTPPAEALLPALLYSLGVSFLVMLIFLRYPSILAGKKAEAVETNLVFALKEMLLQITSGVSIHKTIDNIGRQRYGVVSLEFAKASKDVRAGVPLQNALVRMTERNKSAFLERVVWQLNNGLRAGASMNVVLTSMINDATMAKRSRIRDFAGELNLWGLLFMTFAVAVPSIGLTMMIILSTFGGGSLKPPLFILFISVCFFLQMVVIGFVKSRRPVVAA